LLKHHSHYVTITDETTKKPKMNPNQNNQIPAPTPQPPIAPAPATLTTSFVNNIPVHNHDGPLDDVDLDKIMQEVDGVMKKADKKPPKKGFFHLPHKSKNKAPHPAQPITNLSPAPAQMPQAAPAAQPAPPAEAQVTQKSALSKSSKPKSPIPILAITMALVVTSALIFVAVMAYKAS
jgi:hypothetical protein